jgi:hypothetical protein
VRIPKLLLIQCVLCATWSPAVAGVITATNSNAQTVTDPTGTGGMIAKTVSFTGLEGGFGTGAILGITVTVDFAKPIPPGFFRAFPNEIGLTITSPLGTSVRLIASGNPGTFPDDLFSTAFSGAITFDDSAAEGILTFPRRINPVAGTFRPHDFDDPGVMSGLSGIFGENALGTFTLTVSTDYPGVDAAGPLDFHSFTVTITTENAAPEPVPEPASGGIWATFVLALCGTGWTLRRRRFGRAH